MLNIKNKITNPPDTYIQYPGNRPPSEVYGGTWKSILDQDGIFFRAPGGNASGFESGIQTDAFKAHSHKQMYGSGWNLSNLHIPRGGSATNIESPHNTATVGDVETRPINITIRIWQRTEI